MTGAIATPQLPAETDSADAVFEGGGVKGIAFVGALEAAADIGIHRWVNVAGTSAGAIIAALVAAGLSAEDLRKVLEQTQYAQFADYGWGGRFLGGARNALTSRGVCPGTAFVRWLEDQFEASPLGMRSPTFADLERALPDDLTPEERQRSRFKLRVIASDITEGRMLVLPDDISDYCDLDGTPLAPETLPVARAVRMSMSFPFFFDPVTLLRDGQKHLIVDGGLLSNFPVFLFDGDRPGQLARWTFGFRLYGGSPPEQPTYRLVKRPLWPVPLAKAMFFAATEAWDRRLSAPTAARTISIPTGEVPTLKFTLTDAERDLLRENGHHAAQEFFRTHDTYRNHAGVVAAGPAALSSVTAGSSS